MAPFASSSESSAEFQHGAGLPHSPISGQKTVPAIPDHQLLRRIGRGSYGEVWLARNVMGTARAVKIVSRHAFEHDRPFDREFAGLKRYEPVSRSHEGLVNILQVGRNDTLDCFYYVMELADNSLGGTDACLENSAAYAPRTLSGEIRRRGRLPLDECVSLALSLGSALKHLHRNGLVHRDLKPSNIIFVGGQPKIADVGLVAESGDSRSLVGTEGFFPPQGPGLPQADLYALGKVLYEASTGLDRLRFPHIPAEWLSDGSHEQLIEFNEVVLKACESDPTQRYRTAEEMLADLALLQVGKSVRQLRRLERRLSWARRFGLGTLALALVAMLAYAFADRTARLEREARRRVQRAEGEAKRQLAEARLAQARALRRTGEAGQRFEALEVIAAAARAGPSRELRDEAIGALSVVDFRLVRRLPHEGTSYAEPAIDFQLTRYVCGDAQGNLSVRRVTDDSELFRLPSEGRRPPDWVAGFSLDSRFLALRPTPDSLVVWDLETREKVLSVPAQGAEVYPQFLPDSRGLLWSAGAQPLRRCDLPSGIIRAKWPVRQAVWRFSCSPDGHYAALAYFDTNGVDVVDLENGQVRSHLPHSTFVQGLQWHRRKPLLATAAHDRNVYVWDPIAGTRLGVCSGHQGVPAGLDFHPTRPLLASSGWDGTTRLWDVGTTRQLVVLQEAGDNLQFSQDGRWLTLDEYSDAHVLLCQVAAETVCQSIPALSTNSDFWCSEVAFSPDGQWLAGAQGSGVQLLEVASGRPVCFREVGRVWSLWFEPKGDHLVTSGEGGLLRWTFSNSGPARPGLGEPVVLHEADLPTRSACRTGGDLAWADAQFIHVWRGEAEAARIPTPAPLDRVALSPGGSRLAASEFFVPCRVHLWDLSGNTEVPVSQPGGRSALAFSPDGAFLVIGGPEDFLFWKLSTGEVYCRLPRHHTSTGDGKLAFSPDGKLLAIARTRSTIALLEYPSLRELASFSVPQAPGITALCFDAASQRLAVATAINQIDIWSLPDMRRHLAQLSLDW